MEKEPTRKELPNGQKRCPFQSAFENIPCDENCELYRPKKNKGFNCPLSELTSISWNANGRPTKY